MQGLTWTSCVGRGRPKTETDKQALRHAIKMARAESVERNHQIDRKFGDGESFEEIGRLPCRRCSPNGFTNALCGNRVYGSLSLETTFEIVEVLGGLSCRQTHGLRESRQERVPRPDLVVPLSAAPLFFGLSLYRWCFRVLELQPVLRSAGSVTRSEPLRHDALEAHLAGVPGIRSRHRGRGARSDAAPGRLPRSRLASVALRVSIGSRRRSRPSTSRSRAHGTTYRSPCWRSFWKTATRLS